MALLPDRLADLRQRSQVPGIIQRPSPNCGSRFGSAIDRVIIHTTEGEFGGSVTWLCSIESGVSAHYVVGPDGRIAQLVLEGSTARHAGNPDYNRRSIGVELATHSWDEKGGVTPGDRAFPYSLLWPAAQLVADILRRHGLPATREVVIGHDQVPDPLDPARLGGRGHHRDPGPAFPWPAFLADVEALLHTHQEVA